MIIRCIFRVPYRTHNDIVTRLEGGIVPRINRRLAMFLFSLINHDNTVVKHKTNFKLSCSR